MGRLVKSFGRVVTAEAMNARFEALELRAAARRDADTIVAHAHAEAAVILAEATRTGNDAGRELARAEFRELLAAAAREGERIRRAAVPAARKLAVRMAERIVRRTVELEPRVLDDIVERALETAGAITGAEARGHAGSGPASQAGGSIGTVTIRVHPDDLSRVASDEDRLVAKLHGGLELRIVGDPSVDRSGCIVDTPRGRLDARLQTQLAVLERAALGTNGDAHRE